jgi:purine-binding chemotaxis protein CheW
MEATGTEQYILYFVDDLWFALPLHQVKRVIRAVEVTRLPGAPDLIEGIINVQGEVIPVFHTRRYLGFPVKPMDPTDYFLLVRTENRPMALWVTDVQNITHVDPRQISRTGPMDSKLNSIQGVIKNNGQIIYIQDVEKILSASAGKALDRILDDLGESEKLPHSDTIATTKPNG